MNRVTTLPELAQWVPPDGLDRCRPREMRLTIAGKTAVLGAVLLILCGAGLAVALQVQVWRKAAAGPPLFLPYLLAVPFAVGGSLAFLPLLRQRWLLAEGRAAPGVVTRHGRKDQHGRVYYFEFRVLSGATVEGRAGPSHRPPPVGRPICVLYDPNQPRR